MALLSSHISPPLTVPSIGDTDHKNRYALMATLEERRQDTQAIRQLWLGLQKHRLRQAQHHSPPSRIASPRERKSSCISNVFPVISESAPPAPGSRRQSHTDPREIPYYTAITRRPGKQQNATRFNALNRKMVFRLPNVYDHPLGLPAYATRDIREWKNEITKVVPERPDIYTPTSSVPRDLSFILPPKTMVTNDNMCMFQPMSSRMKGNGKDYVVNPEWPSEGITPRSVRDRAHCVYVWPI